MEIKKTIITEAGLDEFQIRLLKSDGVGLLTDRSGNNFLILDSLDYWYDVIQEAYPSKIKCSCKNDWFKVAFYYKYRENSLDIKEVSVSTICSNCGKTANRMSVDIDYSPTNELLDTPLTYCKNPKIKYKYSRLSGLWSSADWAKVLKYLTEDLGLTAYYFYWENKKRFFKTLSIKQALEIGLLCVYFSKEAPKNAELFSNESGPMIDYDLWRKQELIHMFRLNVMGFTMYFTLFCNQYINKGVVKDKTPEFEEITTTFVAWLKENFTSERYQTCFDNKELWLQFKPTLKR